MIKITSKRHLFRRCGVAHPKGETVYPDSRFSPEELAVLKAEPMLSVIIVEDAVGAGPGPARTVTAKKRG